MLWDNPIIFPMLKVKEIIGFTRSIYNISEFPQDTYNFLELDKIRNRFCYQLSKGERKRVAIFLSVLHKPSLLLLDEPTPDLDLMIREVIWRNIFKNKNRSVLFTTHLWDEAGKYATKIYFIYDGEIISKALSPQKLLEESEYQQKIVVSKELIRAEEFDHGGEILVIPDDKFLKIYTKKGNAEILHKVQKYTCNFSIMPVELEDVYQIIIKLRK